jgi:HEAT repeat protein
VYQQLWENHRLKEDQGLLRVANDAKHPDKPISDIIWSELATLLASSDSENVLYAITQLDEMSSGSDFGTSDFERSTVLKTMEPFIRAPDHAVAKKAVTVLGSRNPYMSPDAAGWLATIGKGHIPGYSEWTVPEESPTGAFWKPLAEVADSDRPAELRALAILALGRTREPQLQTHVSGWLSDDEPRVRAAATILLVDSPDLATDETIAKLANDPEPSVRAGIARAIGFGQWEKHVDLLAKLVDDEHPDVTQAAALSLLSLPLKNTRASLEANSDHADYGPLFVNALAQANPEPYLDALADNVRRERVPQNWWGGHVPWGVSWEILFSYAQSHPAKLKSGRLDAVLDALESPDYYSSSEPRDLYALYLQNGLSQRAAKFRKACRQRLSYDIDYFFNMVDERPDTYRRD